MTHETTQRPIRSIAIIGGGSAGWMAAAAISKMFGRGIAVTLVESEEIGLIGVGEATVPHLSAFNRLLEIDEAEFVRQTRGSFKLGIQFDDWGRIGDRYVHGFGTIGRDLGMLPFHQYWLKARALGRAGEIGRYSLNTVAAPLDRFMAPPRDAPPNSPLAEIAYAYHFDAVLYARFLRGRAEAQGVRRIEGKVVAVHREPQRGFVDSVEMESGDRVRADLFLDCTDFRALLIGDALGVGFDDWTHWLPCDRALAVPCAKVGPPAPYTRATAREAGWQWRIPLQHRTGNGHVYSSAFTSDDRAADLLLANLDGQPLADPKPLRFTSGKRRKLWDRNVVALGLAGGFLEPLESTAIYLVQAGINRLMQLFPQADCAEALQTAYNGQSAFEYERIRDFLILHYHVTSRDDSPFWNHLRTMAIPDSLRETIDLFAENGQFFRNGSEMFALTSWVQVMLGQGLIPRGHHPAVDWVAPADLHALVDHVEKVIASNVALMPAHDQFIARCCAAPG
ncbi:tryptophan halogenase [Sphingomonas sp. SORGH_AS802]|uniref:tryptophan halogenase family protein n=1 Tax=unclassified Sphingomonas TaxID=196159 RepID=UPI00285916AB|nr:MULTISPECIES: tryptophan 7-halogenase [unclassified Sphingomonas]MDR6129027.1 tryptophan halogenase [Sphingomonas sp. SORGH_AS_0438]MDR6136415.1 tryptophan halogenase [Sphingomonas sp. SORGH_AS_0802]